MKYCIKEGGGMEEMMVWFVLVFVSIAFICVLFQFAKNHYLFRAVFKYKPKDTFEWHSWFAWYPVPTSYENDIPKPSFLKTVERKQTWDMDSVWWIYRRLDERR
jgi:hypothetical protein